MSEVSERWHDWRYDGRGYYLVNDPEITFQDDAEADAYCDEHNRELVGQAAAEERAKIVASMRKTANMNPQTPEASAFVLLLCKAIEAKEHLK